MNIKRAEEIMNSKGIIDVEFKTEPVWLESIDEYSATADVKIVNTDKHMSVPLSELQEP